MVHWKLEADVAQVCARECGWLAIVAALFAVQEVVQAYLGFSLFDLSNGHHPWGMLDVQWEEWEETQGGPILLSAYLTILRKKLKVTAALAKEASGAAQAGQYEKVQLHTFTTSQLVLLLFPMPDNKSQVKWQGPYNVQRSVGEVDYEIAVPHKGFRLFLVNMLKAWTPRECLLAMVLSQIGRRRGNSGSVN